MKNGTIEFQIDGLFYGIAIKQKSLKKGNFFSTVIINDILKSGSSVEMLAYVDEN